MALNAYSSRTTREREGGGEEMGDPTEGGGAPKLCYIDTNKMKVVKMNLAHW